MNCVKAGFWSLGVGYVSVLTGCPDWRVAEKAPIAETIHYAIHAVSFNPGSYKWDGRADFYFNVGVSGPSVTSRLQGFKSEVFTITTESKNALEFSFDIPGSLVKDKVSALSHLDQHFLSIRVKENFELFPQAFDEKNINLATMPTQGPVKVLFTDEPRPGRWAAATGAQLVITVQEIYTQPDLNPVPKNTYRYWAQQWWASPDQDFETWELLIRTFEQVLIDSPIPLTDPIDAKLAESIKPLIVFVTKQKQILKKVDQILVAIDEQAPLATILNLFRSIKPMDAKEFSRLTLITVKEKLAGINNSAKVHQKNTEAKIAVALKKRT